MIKFAQAGTQGWLVVLGITLDNLRRIAEDMQPIAFPASQVGLGEGTFTIGTRGMGAALRAQLGPAFASCLELDQADADALLRGEPIERSLGSLGYPRDGQLLLFLGPSEDAILASLRGAGLVTDATRLAGPDPAPPSRRPWWKFW